MLLVTAAADVACQWALNKWTAAEERGRGSILCPAPYIMCAVRMTGEIRFVVL